MCKTSIIASLHPLTYALFQCARGGPCALGLSRTWLLDCVNSNGGCFELLERTTIQIVYVPAILESSAGKLRTFNESKSIWISIG